MHPDCPDVFAITLHSGDVRTICVIGLKELERLRAQCSDALASYERLKGAGFPGYLSPQ